MKELKSVTSNVLEVARIESGRFELTYSEFNLFELLNTVWRESKDTAVNRNITVEMSFPKKLGQQFKGDEGRIRKVLLNLVRYCIKFTRNDTINLAFKERRRFNNTSEIEFQFKLLSGYLPPDSFAAGENEDTNDREIEILSTMQIINKLRGSIETTILNGRVQSFLVVIPLFSIG